MAELLATEPSKKLNLGSASSFTSRGGSADEGVDPVPEDVAAAAADSANTSDQQASQDSELTIRPKSLAKDTATAESGEGKD